ncbi:MAG: hypothetical protein HQL91_01100 [Magnetococcales bacterium]|nr:hypothetical protein [Magnetococcales bacterium]
MDRSTPLRRTAPGWLIGLLLLALGLQLVWKWHAPAPEVHPEDLGPPPASALMRLSTLGDPVAVAIFWMLWLQTFDDQAGVTVSLQKMDYHHLAGWLERILELDPDSEYPLLAAIRVYGFVPEPQRQRRMLDFVHRAFLQAPRNRWQWLTFAALQARHRLEDGRLARKYMDDLEKNIQTGQLPFWVRGLHARILYDQNELAGARTVIGGILLHQQATDRQKLALGSWLERLEEAEKLPDSKKN